MARPRRNTAAAASKADTTETVQAVKKESAVCAAEEIGAVSAALQKDAARMAEKKDAAGAAAQKDAACVSEKKGTAGAAEAQDTFHEAGRTVVVEFAGKQIMAKDVLKKAEEAYLAAHKGVGIKTLELYISPEQNAAYYVVNGEASKDFVIQL